MKLNLIKNISRFPELTLAAALIGSLLALTAAAEVPSGKGGAGLLMKPAVTQNASTQTSMSCGSCADVFVTRKDATAHGSTKPMVQVAQHTCNGCSTAIQTAGQGKAKHEVAVHQCTMKETQASNCCGANPSNTAMRGKAQPFQVAPVK